MSTVNPNDNARIRQNRADAEAAFTQDTQPMAARSPEEIEADISRTRAQMDGTLSQLQRKLGGAPNDVADQFVHNLTEAVIRNPVPAALLATGVVWVMGSTLWRHRVPVALAGSAYAWRKVYGPEEGVYYRPETYQSGMGDDQSGGRMQQMGGKISGAGHQAAGSVKGAAASGRQRLSETSHRTMETIKGAATTGRERLSETSHRVSERSAQMRDQIAGAVGSARMQVTHLSESARYRARHAQMSGQRMVREQPLLTAALGLAAGAAIGALLPRTRREDELMGETRDRLMHRAREEMHEQVDRGTEAAKAVSQAATEAAKEEAKRQAGSNGAARAGGSDDAQPTRGM